MPNLARLLRGGLSPAAGPRSRPGHLPFPRRRRDRHVVDDGVDPLTAMPSAVRAGRGSGLAVTEALVRAIRGGSGLALKH
jgi:hypothetical protein